MSGMTETRRKLLKIANIAVMAAMVAGLCFIGGAQTIYAYAACLLSGMLLGPALGGAAAGVGSALYELIAGSGFPAVLITLVSHFAMAFFCGFLLDEDKQKRTYYRTLEAAALGVLIGLALHIILSSMASVAERIGWITKLYTFLPLLLYAAAAALLATMIYQAVLRKEKWGTAAILIAAMLVMCAFCALWKYMVYLGIFCLLVVLICELLMEKSELLTKIIAANMMMLGICVLSGLSAPYAYLAYALCLAGSMLLGPLLGGVASGLGIVLQDILSGCDMLTAVIAFLTLFTMGFVCGRLTEEYKEKLHFGRMLEAALIGALSGVWMQTVLNVASYNVIQENGWGEHMAHVPQMLVSVAIASLLAAMVYQLLQKKIKWSLKRGIAAIVMMLAVFGLCFLGSDHAYFVCAVCMLGSMLLGPLPGGAASGLGFALYDLITGCGLLTISIDFLTLFTLCVICGLLAEQFEQEIQYVRMLTATGVGALAGLVMHVLLILAASPAIPADGVDDRFAHVPLMILCFAIAAAAVPLLYQIAFGPKKKWSLTTIVFTGVVAAMVYVVTLFRFPLLGSKVHFANAVCLLGGMLLGPAAGGMAAGLGSALYDAFTGYDALGVLITFVSKFAMAYVCGLLMGRNKDRKSIVRIVIAAAAGALTYVALYMLKTGIYGAVAGNIWVPITQKFPASIINAVVAIIAAPIFYHAVMPALKAGGVLKKLQETD